MNPDELLNTGLALAAAASLMISQGKTVLRKLGIRRYHNQIIWALMLVAAAVAGRHLGLVP